MALTHNSTTDDREPDWAQVDKTRLPRQAFAGEGEPDKKSTWSFPHHWVKGGADDDGDGIYDRGDMLLHRQGLNSAWAAAMGARAGQRASAEVVEHLRQHRKALGLEEEMSEGQDKRRMDYARKFINAADVGDVSFLKTAMQDEPRKPKFVIGVPKDEGGTRVQSVIFPKDRGWTKDQAMAWLKEHGFRADKADETGDSFRFRQEDPGKFIRFRIMDTVSMSEQDFGENVSLASPLVVVPMDVGLGHDEQQRFLDRSDLPAAGWIARLRRSGEKLLADFRDVPQAVKELFDRGAFKKISAEIYRDFNSGEPDGPNGKVLRRVAMLGAEIPQVKTLDDISGWYRGRDGWNVDAVEVFEAGRHRGEDWSVRDLDEMVKNFKTLAAGDMAEDKAVKLAAAFAEHGTMMHPDESKAGNGEREKILDVLRDAGLDPDLAGDQTPAAFLAEVARIVGDLQEQVEAMKQEGGTEEASEKNDLRRDMTRGNNSAMETTELTEELSKFAADLAEVLTFAAKKRRAPRGASALVKELYARKDVRDPEALAGWLRFHRGEMGEQDMSEKIDGRLQELEKKMTEKVRELDELARKRAEQEKRAMLDRFCEAEVQAGRLLPAQINAGLKEALYCADSGTVVSTMKEGDKEIKRTQLDLMMDSIRKGPKLVVFGDKVPDGKVGDPAKVKTEDEARVAAWFDRNQSAMAGHTRDGFIKIFRESGQSVERFIPELAARN